MDEDIVRSFRNKGNIARDSSVHIPCERWSIESDLSLVREDRERCTSGVPVIMPMVYAG